MRVSRLADFRLKGETEAQHTEIQIHNLCILNQPTSNLGVLFYVYVLYMGICSSNFKGAKLRSTSQVSFLSFSFIALSTF